MSQPPVLDVERLRAVAHELREVFEERGYRIDSALDVDEAFGSGSSRSWLARDLAIDAVSAAASRHGLDFRPVNGSGREFRSISGGVDRRYRLRKAQKRADGSYVIPTNSDSAFSSDDETDESLFVEETWVLGYTLSSDLLLQDVFIAPVLGVEGERPGRLIMGRHIELLTSPPTPTGFQPVDEDLPGFDADEGDGKDGEFGS